MLHLRIPFAPRCMQGGPGEGIGSAIVLGDTIHVEAATVPGADELAFFDAAYARQMSGGDR